MHQWVGHCTSLRFSPRSAHPPPTHPPARASLHIPLRVRFPSLAVPATGSVWLVYRWEGLYTFASFPTAKQETEVIIFFGSRVPVRRTETVGNKGDCRRRRRRWGGLLPPRATRAHVAVCRLKRWALRCHSRFLLFSRGVAPASVQWC